MLHSFDTLFLFFNILFFIRNNVSGSNHRSRVYIQLDEIIGLQSRCGYIYCNA